MNSRYATWIAALSLITSTFSMAADQTPRTIATKGRAAKCEMRWVQQASLSPLLSALDDPSLVECGKPKDPIGPSPDRENRTRLAETFRGAGPKD